MTYLQHILSGSLLYILLANFVLICAFFFIARRDIVEQFKKIRLHIWIALIIILAVGSCLRFTSPGCASYDGLCWDYVTTATNMLENQYVEDFFHPKAYSLLLAFVFLFFGSNFNTIFYLNVILSSLTIFIVFLLAYVMFKREDVALFSVMIYSLFPSSIIYAKLNASEVTSVFFFTLTVLMYIISLKHEKRALYVLSFLLLTFTINVRTDNSILIPVFITGIVLNRDRIMFHKLRMPLIIFLAFMIPSSQYYLSGDDIFGPEGHVNYEERPNTFSLSYLIPNVQFHINNNLSQSGFYPTILYIFLFFSLLYILKEHNIVLLVSWIISFFLLYGLWWDTIYTAPTLYQLTLQPAMAILMGYGIFKAKKLVEGVLEKGSLNMSHVVKMSGVFATLFLITIVFHSSTNVFAMERDEPCFIENIIYLGGYIGDNGCLLIENSHSEYALTFFPITVIDFLLPDKNVGTSLSEFKNSGEIYYLYIDHDVCDTTFFGYERPLYSQLKEEYVLKIVEERNCISLYKIWDLI